MKKWFFSNNGKVTAPLDLDAAKEYLASNPNVYGWHPSFNQWKPVNCISEFVDVLPPTVQSPLIPKEISDKFLAKKQRLESKLTSIDDSINHSQSSLAKFDKQIEEYKDLTQNLNDDVKGAIDNIEKKYNNLRRKLSQVKDAVNIAETEMTEVVDDFDRRMSSNDIFMPSCNQSLAMSQDSGSNALSSAQVSRAKLAQEKLATPHSRADSVKANVEVAPVKSKESVKNQNTAQKTEKASSLSQDAVEASHSTKDGFNGMKNIMKSVFKGDSKVEKEEVKVEVKKVDVKKVEIKKGKDEPLSMAERLKMAQNNQ